MAVLSSTLCLPSQAYPDLHSPSQLYFPELRELFEYVPKEDEDQEDIVIEEGEVRKRKEKEKGEGVEGVGKEHVGRGGEDKGKGRREEGEQAYIVQVRSPPLAAPIPEVPPGFFLEKSYLDNQDKE
jgi:hypothetical protein